MSTRWYPLYKRGNPQLRVFLPNFWMKLIQPTEPQPPNIVQFMVSMEMTSHDIKNYLQKIYKIPVLDVRTRIRTGETKKNEKGYVIKKDDCKLAYITMPKDQVFEFPNLFPESNELEETNRTYEELKKIHQNKMNENKKRPGLPSWFF